MLLFFTVLTVFCLTRFHTERHEYVFSRFVHTLLIPLSPFSPDWWVWLTFTGISIGCVASVKWVGLFVTALVGVYTLEDLWEKFGDLRMRKVCGSVISSILWVLILVFSAIISTTG